MLISEVDRILGVVATIDDWVGRIKARDRGLSAGQLVMSMAECMLSGGDFMCDLDNLARADVAGAELRAVPDAPASTTFIALARRFDQVRIGDLESAVGAMAATWFAALPAPAASSWPPCVPPCWVQARQRGSHRQFIHAVKPGRVTVAGNLGDDVRPGTLASVFRQAGLGGRGR